VSEYNKYLNIRGRINSDHFLKAKSNILRGKRNVYRERKRWSSSASLNVDDIVTNKVLNTRGFRQEHVTALQLHVTRDTFSNL
jgi:hypothetical protein